MTENDDQRALSAWIIAGLEIPEVRALKGDASYLLRNMIAKFSLAAEEYRVSRSALLLLRDRKIDLATVHVRSKVKRKKQGESKSPFIFEHAVPAAVVLDRLLRSDRTPDRILGTLRSAGPVAVLLQTENDLLRQAKLQSSMPKGWSWGDSPLARYETVGIELANEVLAVRGAIIR